MQPTSATKAQLSERKQTALMHKNLPSEKKSKPQPFKDQKQCSM